MIPRLGTCLGRSHAGWDLWEGNFKHHLSLPESGWLRLLLEISWGPKCHQGVIVWTPRSYQLILTGSANVTDKSLTNEEFCYKLGGPVVLQVLQRFAEHRRAGSLRNGV